jgi:tetratricopeptide (TPR) repeat protein
MLNNNDTEARRSIQVRDLLERGCRKFKEGEYEASLELFELALTLNPRSAEAYAWLAAVYGRKIETVWNMVDKMKLLSQLEKQIAASLEIDPNLPLARRMNGAKLLNSPDMLGGDPTAAVDEFLYCIEHGMDEAELWVMLAECYVKTDEPVKAIQALKEALIRDPAHETASAWLHRLA